MCSSLPGLDVTLPSPMGILAIIAVLYSIVPWIAGLALIVAAIYKRRTTLIAGVVLLITLIVLSEVVLKNIIKQPRPKGSCLKSSGMPSSHSVLAFGFITFIALEMFYHQWHFSRVAKLEIFLATVFLLAPVPGSRVGLNDHSSTQVGVGIIIGSIIATVYFCLLHFFAGKHFEDIAGRAFFVTLGIVNDYVIDYDDEELLELVLQRTAVVVDVSEKYKETDSSPVRRKSSARFTDAVPVDPLSAFKAFDDAPPPDWPPPDDPPKEEEEDEIIAHPDDDEVASAAAARAAAKKAPPPPPPIPRPGPDEDDDVLFIESDED